MIAKLLLRILTLAVELVKTRLATMSVPESPSSLVPLSIMLHDNGSMSAASREKTASNDTRGDRNRLVSSMVLLEPVVQKSPATYLASKTR
jgi:hypothetical protein